MADSVLYITEDDRDWVSQNWGLDHGQLFYYGTWRTGAVSAGQKSVSKKEICKNLGLAEDSIVVLFNGAFDYLPNIRAMEDLVHHIAPLLEDVAELQFVICGGGMSDSLQAEIATSPNIHYAGFVPDINLYLEAADLFVNPVTLGGGIKTKLVESIAAGLTSISYESGARGIPLDYTEDKLHIIEDGNAQGMADAIRHTRKSYEATPHTYYQRFNWYRQVDQLRL